MRRLLPILSIFALAALPCAAAFAQQSVSISAEVDKTTVSLNDSLSLTVTVSGSGADMPEPQLPSLPNFNVYSSGQSNNISIVNGRVSSSLVYSFSLTPRFVGKATIKPITLRAGGQVYQTEPIDVTIVPANTPSQYATRQARPQARTVRPQSSQRAARRNGAQVRQDNGDPAFVKALVSKQSPYVNEQVTLTIRFYSSVPLMGNPQYAPPPLKGILSEDLPPVRTGLETINGREYQYSEIKTALFGATAGKAAIDPAKVQYQPRNDEMMDPDMPDFFQRFFAQGMGAETRETSTKPLVLDVKPLPDEGKPASFSGAVGKYSASSSVDVKELKTGEALNLIITISGTGNLKTISAPPLPALPNFRIYDTVTSLNMTKSGDLVQGTKTFKTILIPKSSGMMQLPAMQFSYFDPSDGAYHTEETRPIQIKVNPGAAPQAPAVYSQTGEQHGAAVTTLGEDIRYIAENKTSSPLSERLIKISALGKLNYIPAALFLISMFASLIFNSGNGDETLLKFRKAYANAKRPVKNAEKLFAEGKVSQAAAALSEALNTYLCGKLSCPIGGLRLKEIGERLKSSSDKLRPETLEQLENLWQELEQLRFAPSRTDAAALKTLPHRLLALLNTLEKELGK